MKNLSLSCLKPVEPFLRIPWRNKRLKEKKNLNFKSQIFLPIIKKCFLYSLFKFSIWGKGINFPFFIRCTIHRIVLHHDGLWSTRGKWRYEVSISRYSCTQMELALCEIYLSIRRDDTFFKGRTEHLPVPRSTTVNLHICLSSFMFLFPPIAPRKIRQDLQHWFSIRHVEAARTVGKSN